MLVQPNNKHLFEMCILHPMLPGVRRLGYTAKQMKLGRLDTMLEAL